MGIKEVTDRQVEIAKEVDAHSKNIASLITMQEVQTKSIDSLTDDVKELVNACAKDRDLQAFKKLVYGSVFTLTITLIGIIIKVALF